MKDVNIEFVNIQSHEHTRFSLHPGLNFILAEDNNVGKSTIFKVLLCAMELPQVSASDVDELIRGGCTQACARFKYDDVTCTLWLFRGEGKASRAFFELVTADGVSSRSLSAPSSLRDAFDIVSGDDGKVVNFNDADSVQLIVQDTPKNDEVLAKVLVDVKVDAIKANAIRLNQQIQQDYRMSKSKLDDVTTILSTMNYVIEVDDFKSEKRTLTAACSVADSICDTCLALEDLGPAPDLTDIKRLRSALNVVASLQEVTMTESPILRIVDDKLFEHLKACLHVVSCLDAAVDAATVGVLNIQEKQLDNARRGIATLDTLTRAVASLSAMCNSARELQQLDGEKKRVLQKLRDIAPFVQCPVKGEVFFSDEKCISTGN